MNSTLEASTGKAPFQLVYGGNVNVPLDPLTGATQLSCVQAAGKMDEEVLWLVDVAKAETLF